MAKANSENPAGKAKQRIVGTVVLIAIFVIIVLILPSRQEAEVEVLKAVDIPPKPENLNVKILPIEVPEPPRQPRNAKPPGETRPSAPEPGESKAKVEPAPVISAPVEAVTQEPVTPAGAREATTEQSWVIQVGSFSSKENADALRDRLKADNYKAFVYEAEADSVASYRVYIGPNSDRTKLEPFKTKLEKLLNTSAIIKAYKP